MFHEDNSFRDMLVYGSVAMLAALAMPSKKAHAAEFYLCGDGRMLELDNANRPLAMKQDACVKSWYAERQKVVDAKSTKSSRTTHTAQAAMGEIKSVGYQIETSIQTATIEPLINAVEVPENKAIIHKPVMRDQSVGQRRAHPERKPKMASVKSHKGLRHMGGGIYADTLTW